MLKKCPECQKEVSSNAEKCPNCGHPLRPNDTQAILGILCILAGIVFLWFVWKFF